MTADTPALRALIIYGLCVPFALLMGYLVGGNWDYSTFAFFGLVALVICAPLVMKWHRALLVAAINASAYAFFIPGRPQLWLVLGLGSLTISVLQLTLSRRFTFLNVGFITLPVLMIGAVVLFTAKFTGGIGFHTLGGENVGGRRYIDILGAVMVYFALSARQIPPQKASLYCGLFFLSGATSAISSLVHFISPGFYWIFLLFPPEAMPGEGPEGGSATILRLGGVAFASQALIAFLLCRYGVRGIFLAGKPWRTLALFTCIILSLFGGFRGAVVFVLIICTLLVWLEGLYTSRLVPVVLLAGVLAVALGVPFVQKLPLSLQRALSVLPVEVDPAARAAAQASSEWRIQIWREMLPEVPKYLLLGKGYLMNAQDWSEANSSTGIGNENSTIIAGDYHSGPLDVVIPFGIWGVLAFAWLLWAGGRLLYLNYAYGDPSLKTINTYFLAAFLTQTITFIFVFGSFHSDLLKFASLLGMSVSLNGGVCKPARAFARQPVNIRIRPPVHAAPGFSH